MKAALVLVVNTIWFMREALQWSTKEKW